MWQKDRNSGPEEKSRTAKSHTRGALPSLSPSRPSTHETRPRAAHIPAARTDVRKEDGSTFRSLRAKTPVAP